MCGDMYFDRINTHDLLFFSYTDKSTHYKIIKIVRTIKMYYYVVSIRHFSYVLITTKI